MLNKPNQSKTQVHEESESSEESEDGNNNESSDDESECRAIRLHPRTKSHSEYLVCVLPTLAPIPCAPRVITFSIMHAKSKLRGKPELATNV